MSFMFPVGVSRAGDRYFVIGFLVWLVFAVVTCPIAVVIESMRPHPIAVQPDAGCVCPEAP